jgi:hypothetical protein
MNREDNISLRDEKGDVANLTISDVYPSNGVVQVVDTVLLPKKPTTEKAEHQAPSPPYPSSPAYLLLSPCCSS